MDGVAALPAWSKAALAVAGYLVVCRLLRYRARDGLANKLPYKTKDDLKNMTNKDAWEIQRILFATEFPFTAEKALQFALFRLVMSF